MRPLERIFFIACINTRQYSYPGLTLSIRDIINIFEVFGFNRKQLTYYVEKWLHKGFYDYGVNLELGWFYPDKLTGEYKVLYEKYKKEVKQNE